MAACQSFFWRRDSQLHCWKYATQNFSGKMPLISLKTSTVFSPRLWKEFWRITETIGTGCQKVKLTHLNCIEVQKTTIFTVYWYHACNEGQEKSDYKCHGDTLTVRYSRRSSRPADVLKLKSIDTSGWNHHLLLPAKSSCAPTRALRGGKITPFCLHHYFQVLKPSPCGIF